MSAPLLQVRNLSKSYAALKVTDDVSLDVHPGEIHAIIGPNGAGKTTLIAQLSGQLRPDSGHVHYMGQDITRLPMAARKKRKDDPSRACTAMATFSSAVKPGSSVVN